MVELSFPKDFKIEEYLKSQMELYCKYKDEMPHACDAVLKATVAHLEMWHLNILEKSTTEDINVTSFPEKLYGNFSFPRTYNTDNPCKDCPNYGKSTICQCTLGGPKITC